MPSVLVRDLTSSTHEQLVRKAQDRGQSLQQYLAGELTRLAASPTLDEMLARIGERRGGSVGLAQAVEDLARDRR